MFGTLPMEADSPSWSISFSCYLAQHLASTTHACWRQEGKVCDTSIDTGAMQSNFIIATTNSPAGIHPDNKFY